MFQKSALLCAVLLCSALAVRADSVFSGSAVISVSSPSLGTETTDWTFTLTGGDPFAVQHTFTDFTVFSYGGWQLNSGGSDFVSVSGNFPSPLKNWLPEIEGFSNTPIPAPMTWNVDLFHGVAGDQCKFCADWTPAATSVPEPSTFALVLFGGLTSGFVALRRRNFRRDYCSTISR